MKLQFKEIKKKGGSLYFVFAVMLQIIFYFFVYLKKNIFMGKVIKKKCRLKRKNVKKKIEKTRGTLTRGSYGAYGLHCFFPFLFVCLYYLFLF